MAAQTDRWSRWLLERRDAGSERQRAVALDVLSEVRDRLLALAEPLDVVASPGCISNAIVT